MEANFNVTKWRTNDEDLCKLINLYNKNEGVNSGVEMSNLNSINKVLELYCNHKKDIISLKINEVFKEAINIMPTKRNILSIITSVYDPVGYLQPIVIKLKILFQKLCKSKLQWDDDIGILANKWKEIVASITSSETVSFNRCFYLNDINDPIDKCYLHGFSDTSISAFAAVVYFKSVSRCGNVAIKFVTLKSRIVPLNKTYTIPKLELLRNVILSSLIRFFIICCTKKLLLKTFFVGRIHLFLHPRYELLIKNSNYLYRIESSKFVKMYMHPYGDIVTRKKILQIKS